MEELLEASRLFRTCLDRYINACSVISASHNPADKDCNSPLLNAIKNELRTVADCEKDVRNAKSILARSRNISQSVVPINALPSEVLERIFQLAYHSWLYSVDIENFEPEDGEDEGVLKDDIKYNMSVKLPSPMFPEALTHVCAHWRQVALSSHRLWSRIDLPIFSQTYKWLILRGKIFASRAAPMGLDVHIFMTNDRMEGGSLYDRLNRFCAIVGSKIGALQLTNGVNARPGSYDSMLTPLLNASFAHLAPGMLDHLALIDHYPPKSKFIKSAERHQGSLWSSPILIKLPQRQIDEILRPIRSLWLKNHFFPWESPAYYGLVDLRLLTSGEERPLSIQSAQLKDILSSCPKLRTFHCGTEVVQTKTVTEGTFGPVYLSELEHLHLRRMKHDQHQHLLPLISPGPKPLSLSVQVAKPSPSESLFSATVVDFFTRSNVTALYITGRYTHLSLQRLLKDSPPSTRTIGLHQFYLDQGNTGPIGPEGSSLTQLDCLNLMDCSFHLIVLQEMTDICSVRVVKFFERRWVDHYGNRIMKALATVFPVVKCIDKSTPIEEWDSWGVVEWELGTE